MMAALEMEIVNVSEKYTTGRGVDLLQCKLWICSHRITDRG